MIVCTLCNEEIDAADPFSYCAEEVTCTRPVLHCETEFSHKRCAAKEHGYDLTYFPPEKYDYLTDKQAQMRLEDALEAAYDRSRNY